MKKKLLYGSALTLTAFAGFLGGFLATRTINIYTDSLTASVANSSMNENMLPINTDTTIYFVGDMMLDRSVRSSVNKNFNGDYSALFQNLGELKSADILFVNLEGDVSDVGNNVGSKYSFRMDPIVLQAIKDAGFDIVSFANNHVGDWNMNAFKDTLTRLDTIGILKTGAGTTKTEIENPTIIYKNGIRFGFLGFSDVGPDWLKATENSPGILLASDPRLPEIISKAKSMTDVLIVSFHWGVEYNKTHNKRQELLAHTAVDNGADMVIGHHPHVIEDIEMYNGHPIAYSLGNFIFDQYFSKDTMEGMLFKATFTGSTLKETSSKIIKLNKYYQPMGIFDKEEIITEKDPTCPKPKKDYADMFLFNLNQNINLPDKAYIPSNLTEIKTSQAIRKGICLTKEANTAFKTMTESAKKDGYIIKATSGWRGYETQSDILNNQKKIDPKNANMRVAKPGYSEHQLGTTIDLSGSSISYASASNRFDRTIEDKWLTEHAYEYGFIQSYPKGKEDTTGYMYEPWHYRYVGIENAKEIKDAKQTITEFLSLKRPIEIKPL